ncbi:unnamed protein product [Porites lobata]|uniref:E3 ubiquitin-protein ligase TRIM71-like n=1 Tax=Porites lobata TaxID=104759 RepID=A0ABN8PWN9_9CNID|nr:unnamed protein product [Porites lobata]
MDVQQLFRNLQKEAECPLCLETVNNPKTLPCLHSFCLECLDKHAGFVRRQLQTTITCPVCQTSFQIPEGDSFKNLPTSYHLNRLVDVLALKDGGAQAQKCGSCDENNTASSYCFVCQNFLCTPCFEAHQRLKATRGHRNVVIEKLQAQDLEDLIHRPVMCSQQYHENQPLEFYCEECKVPICHKCSVVSHNRHTMTDTQKAAQVQKMQMKDALEKVKAETVVYEKKVQKQTELMDRNKKEIMSCEKKMTDLVEDLIRDLREHERVMKTKFAEIYEAQQKHHATQLENFELVLTQLKSCVERGESIVQRNISVEILQTNPGIIKRCEELLKARKPDIYKPSHVNYVVEQKVKILDRIVVSDTYPSLSLAEDVIKVNILSPAGDQLETEIKDTKDGKYTVTYIPQCVGQHRVEIQVNGQPLTGSPWFVQVIPHQYQFAFQFGSKGREQGRFNSPWGIAVNDKSRTLAVADFNNKRIQMFGFEGNFLGQIALNGKPRSLTFTESGDLLVCALLEVWSWRIFLFTENGRFMSNFGGEHVKAPYYISVSSDGRIITSDFNDNRIKVLTPDGKNLLQSFKAPGCHEDPDFIVYNQEKFFASFSLACCVMVFNNAGEYLHDIGSKGSGDGQFLKPIGLVIDKFDRLIVCDAENKRLQLFSLDGKYITQIAGSFFEGGFPRDAFISNTGYLFVSDSDRNCVHVFH